MNFHLWQPSPDPYMQPNVVLKFFPEGIELLHRTSSDWVSMGKLSFASETFDQDVANLLQMAAAIAPTPVRTKIIIPNDQIRYLSAQTGALSLEARDTEARDMLRDATPYALDELSYCCTVAQGRLHIAAVARETLTEASDFAQRHGMLPVCFSAAPEDHDHPEEPLFGYLPSPEPKLHTMSPVAPAPVTCGEITDAADTMVRQDRMNRRIANSAPKAKRLNIFGETGLVGGRRARAITAAAAIALPVCFYAVAAITGLAPSPHFPGSDATARPTAQVEVANNTPIAPRTPDTSSIASENSPLGTADQYAPAPKTEHWRSPVAPALLIQASASVKMVTRVTSVVRSTVSPSLIEPAVERMPVQGARVIQASSELVDPTIGGTRAPGGYLVYLGSPAVVPPLPPAAVTQDNSDTSHDTSLVPETPAATSVTAPSQFAAIRPKARPSDLVSQDELEPEEDDVADVSEGEGESVRPLARPGNFDHIVAAVQSEEHKQSSRTVIHPSSASLSKEATDRNAIDLRAVSLLGISGSAANRTAVVRLANGKVVRVRVGDNLDGGRVMAISQTQLSYVKSNHNHILKMPKGG